MVAQTGEMVFQVGTQQLNNSHRNAVVAAVMQCAPPSHYSPLMPLVRPSSTMPNCQHVCTNFEDPQYIPQKPRCICCTAHLSPGLNLLLAAQEGNRSLLPSLPEQSRKLLLSRECLAHPPCRCMTPSHMHNLGSKRCYVSVMLQALQLAHAAEQQNERDREPDALLATCKPQNGM